MRRLQAIMLLAGTAAGSAACGGAAPATASSAASGPRALVVAPTTAGVSGTCARRGSSALPTPVSTSGQGSSVALARRGATTLAYVADEDDGAVHTVDVDARAELAVTPVDGSPSQVLVLADGRVAVALRDKNRVAVLEPAAQANRPLEERCRAAVAAEPVGLASTPDGRRLLVTSGWGRKLTALDADDLRSLFSVPLAREPRSVLVEADGKRAFVAHVVGARLSAVDLQDGEHAVHPIAIGVGDGIDAPKRTGCQGYALARASVGDGPPRVFAPMVSVDPGEPKATAGYGNSDAWGVRAPEVPVVAVVDATSERPLTRTLGPDLTKHGHECLLPRAAASNGDALLVSCLGIDALLELDARGVDPVRVERRRFAVPAGPTGVAVDAKGDRAVVWSQFAHELSVVDLAAPSGVEPPAAAVLRVALARKADTRIADAIARGRALFHATDDPRISKDGRACASCHPDGREDALTWSTPDGPRQTIMLAGRVGATEPYGWFGANASLKTHIGRTFARLGGRGLSGDRDRADFDALIAYLGALGAPSLEGAVLDPGPRELAGRGRELFFDARQGCASCHVGGGTDKAAHDVKSGRVIEASLKFDTPSLRSVGGTAPYFHDGRYGTLEQLLEGSDGKMGHTMALSRSDLLALAAYLETL